MPDLIERFRRLAEGRSKMRGQDDVIYEIHVGSPGHAWIASSDLIAVADEITALRERVAVLEKAATDLRDDMLRRAEMNKHEHDGDIVVEAGAGVWYRFNESLKPAHLLTPESDNG